MIYFVEGSLASGKTTAAENLFRQCTANGERAILHYEHARENPLDFTSRVFLPDNEYRDFESQIKEAYHAHYKEDYAHGLKKLEDAVEDFCDGKILHIPTLICNDRHIKRQLYELEKYQLCNGVLPAAKYRQFLVARWKGFANALEPSVTHIFEGALLQNPLLDLIGWYQFSDEELADFYRELMRPFDYRNLYVLFITVGKWEEALKKAGQERRGCDPPWIENLIRWVEYSPFGCNQQLTGFTGAVTFCGILESHGLALLDACGIPHRILERE